MRNALYILGQLDDGDVDWMIGAGAERMLAPGDTLIEQGRHPDALSIVLAGRLTVETGSRTIAHRGPGEILGEMSFVDGNPPSATVRAAEPSSVLAVPRSSMTERLSSDTAFAARFYRAMAMVLSARIRDLVRESGVDTDDEPDFPGLGPEIDDAVLANVHLAGARCVYILRRFEAERRG